MSQVIRLADYQCPTATASAVASRLRPGLLEFEYDVQDYPFGPVTSILATVIPTAVGHQGATQQGSRRRTGARTISELPSATAPDLSA
jgi:hypothetical protein